MTSLTYGINTVFDFTTDDDVPESGYIVQASVDGTTWGNPDAVVTSIQSQLLDGSLGKITSFGNRTAVVTIRVRASDSDALAQAEADLMGEVYRDGWNALTWTPPTATVATVFDVVYADLQVVFDDQAEMIAERTYSLILTCLPRPRSASLVTAASLPIQSTTPATTLVNDGSSATNWSTAGQVETRRNLETYPSFETSGSTGWIAFFGSVGAHVDGSRGGFSGSQALFITPATGASQGAINLSYAAGPSIPVTAGTSYRIGAAFYITQGGSAGCGILYRWFNASGAQIGSDASAGFTLSAGYSWEWHSTAATAPAGAVSLSIFPYVNAYTNRLPNGTLFVNDWGLDAVAVEQTSTAGSNPYFDGSTPGAGWIGTPGASASVALANASVTSAGGMVSAGKTFGTSASLSLAQSIDARTQTYVAVTGNVAFQEGGSPSSITFSLVSGSTTYAPARTPTFDASGNFVAYFLVGSLLSAATISVSGIGLSGGFTTFKIDSVSTSDSLPAIGTNRQQARSLTIFGSARTQASLRIATTDASLGTQTLVYTGAPKASGFQPALRSYRTAGPTVTTDATQCSGSTNALATSQGSADTWAIDATLLDPSTYGLYARLIVGSATTVTLNWSATGTTSGVTVTGSRTVTIGTGGQFISIGSLDLPTARVYAGSTDNVVIQLWASASGVTIDDAYLFDSKGRLSIIGTSNASLLLLNSASINEPQATVWTGKAIGSSGGSSTADTKVVFAGNQAVAWDQHEFKPPTESVFVVTPGTLLAQVSMTYYPRWGHHAAQVAA